MPLPEALEDLEDQLGDVLLVDERTILRAMGLLFRTAGLVVEPAGAAGVAALLTDPRFAGRRVATVLWGRNVTEEDARERLLGPDRAERHRSSVLETYPAASWVAGDRSRVGRTPSASRRSR